MILHLNVKITLPENAVIKQSRFPCGIIIPRRNFPWNFTRHTARKTDKPLRMLFYKLGIHPRLAVKALGKAERHHFNKIFVPRFIFAQKNKVIGSVHRPRTFVKPAPRRNINLTADNGLYALSNALIVKIHSRIHISVVCDRKCSLPHFLCTAHHILYPTSAVKETVLAVNVKIDKHFGTSSGKQSVRTEADI